MKGSDRIMLRSRPHRRVKVPTVLQMEAVECGAASLAQVLAYHGRRVPLEELRLACGVSRDGSKASNLLKAAERYGLRAAGYKREPSQLGGLPLPMILHWNFNHFLVYEGMRRGRVYLNDPAVGPRVVSLEEFDRAFTGVAITFERGADFVRGGVRRGLVVALRSRLAGSHASLAYILAAGLLLAIVGLVVPSYSRVFIDDILVQRMSAWTRPLLVAMGATAILAAAITWLQQSHLLRLETKFALATSSRFFWHVLHLPVGFFTQRAPGEIGARVAINDRVAQLLSGELATTVLNLLMIAFYALLMVQYDVVLTVLGVSIATLNMLALQYVSRRRLDLSRRVLHDEAGMLGTAMGGLQTIETLKASGAESDLFARWAGYQAKVIDGQQQLRTQTELLSVLPPLLMAINTALILGLGGARVMDGRLSIGMLAAFQALMVAFMTPVNKIVELGGTLQRVRGDLDRLEDVLYARQDPQAIRDEEEPGAGGGKLSGHLELRDVAFGYSPLEPPLIEHFSLSLQPGSRVALVGSSGSGKTTIARLVCGLYAPTAGQILFDGVPRNQVPRHALTTSFAVVDQDIFLFEGTLKDNLTLWDVTVPEADLTRAATDACIHDEVTARPGGYQNRVEEGGRNFSGGQRQRLEIARALVGNPTLLVLDEATSALDPTTEARIDDNLRRRGCTCLIVAHRLSTIRDCDEIVVLEGGRIVQRGRHDDMVQQDGPYSRLIAAE